MSTTTLPPPVARHMLDSDEGGTADRSRLHLIRRARLDELLDDAHRRPLTLLCAPPGSGKTTLVESWFERRTGPGTWVTAGPSDGAELADVISAARRSGGALVVDDAHNLDPLQLAHLDSLLTDLVRDLDVVISSRADLPLGLPRLRLDGRVREIRAAGLAFTLDEAGELLRQRGVRVTASDVRRLHARSEGWAAGLRLMHYALEQGATPTGLAEDGEAAPAAVSDYLVAEVLDRVEDATRSFLLRTSITERLTPDLAVVLSDDPSGGELLEGLRRRGMFVMGPDDGWYRYHSLFAGLLRARLRLANPALVNELHGRASTWFASHGLYRDAEAHARAGEQWPMLGGFVRRRWRAAVLAGSFASVPADPLPEQALVAEPVLALLSPAGRASVDAQASPLAAEAAVVARLRACAVGEGGGVLPFRAADGELRPIVDVLDLERLVMTDRLDDAIRAAADRGDAAPWIDADAEALVALVLALRGEVDRALVVRDDALRKAAPGLGRVVGPVAVLVTALTDAQRGQPVAREDLEPLTGLSTSWVVRSCARAVLTCGSGRPTVHGVEPRLAHHPLVSRVLVALGALDVVDLTGTRVRVGGDAERAVLHARRCLEDGSLRAASESAGRALAVASGHPRTLTEAAVVTAADGSPDAVHAALAQASTTSIWVPFVTHRSHIRPHLEPVAREHGPHQAVAIRVLEILDDCDGDPVVEPLSDREHTVLCLLPTMMSNDEIASALFVSVNTVKTHLKALYRKLGVDRRRDAVMRGRDLGLLDRI